MIPQTAIPRIIQPNDDQALAIIQMAILSWSRHIPQSADSMIIYPGFHGPARIGDAIDLYHSSPQFTKLIIGGVHPFFYGRDGYVRLNRDMLLNEPFNFRSTDQIAIQDAPIYTQQQADWMAELCIELEVKVAVIMACPFHLPRAYASTLSSLMHLYQKRQLPLESLPALIPYAARLQPTFPLSDFDGASQYDLLPGEFVRFRTYQSTGYLISDADIRSYFERLDQINLM